MNDKRAFVSFIFEKHSLCSCPTRNENAAAAGAAADIALEEEYKQKVEYANVCHQCSFLGDDPTNSNVCIIYIISSVLLYRYIYVCLMNDKIPFRNVGLHC